MKNILNITRFYSVQVYRYVEYTFSQFSFSKKLSSQEKIFFIKRLSFLLKAGIPIVDSLTMIKDQTQSKKFSHILESVVTDVMHGKSLSQSLRKSTGIFGEFALNIIEFGENSGMLAENLEHLAVEMKKRRQLIRKITSACMYPLIVVVMTFVITGFLILYLFPKITPVFISLRIELPMSTRIIMAVSDFINHHVISITLFLITISIIIIMCFKKINACRKYFDVCILHLPIFKSVSKQYNLAHSSRTLGLLLQSGLPLGDAVLVTSKTASNSMYRKEFAQSLNCIDKGETISTHFEKNKKLFPHVFTHIIAVGEKSGNLSNSLLYLSELYEEEVDDFTKNLGTLIEPILMIVMGLLIGFIAISIITPIYGITQNLHK